ncbi:hypothetical protein [Imperialibacter roseus]|uniref:Uncharacterized protein n=1 Tax=Imperialibacter roseus TaxID=1324217 RepID=A0ABZ0IK81_9BACT|nr:hypothetical protein [Imperialibacter roseus]WOK05432.1 hypothetical protein RT717_20365 [Imperialibacter roseus]|tara:strand:- start:12410 stop:13369 length:960 start_codon:yes stop_codon:yes gene_type:complete
MKKLNKYILVLLAMVVVIPACKDEDLVILPEWESAVNAYTVVADGSKGDFLSGDASQDITFDMLWNSIDGKNTVTKIEIFAYFSEAYTDPDGNPAVANYGGADGVSFLTIEGAAVPANKVTTSFTISQDDMYEMFKDSSFDYDKDGTATPVWSNPDKPNRKASSTNFKFVPGDSFSIRWELTTADGRLFDSWSPSVCTEFPGSNCSYAWAIVCAAEISKPVGDWSFQLTDTYGDGWQGGYISVLVDGAEAAQVKIPDGGGSSGSATVNVPAGTTSLSFEWSDDSYNSECVFKIISPSGNVVADVSNPSAGKIKLDLCSE